MGTHVFGPVVPTIERFHCNTQGRMLNMHNNYITHLVRLDISEQLFLHRECLSKGSPTDRQQMDILHNLKKVLKIKKKKVF